MKIEPGTHLGPYQIISQVGRGGMGEVYKAMDPRLNRTVAIKTLHPHFYSKEEWRERFKREAQTIAALQHPHICVIHDVGHLEEIDFLVMEYLEGETLEKLLSKGKLPFDEALQYAIQMADALDKAHRRGVTHRDLKPANVMITKSGVKLLDFGLAKMQSPDNSTLETSAQEGLTRKGMVFGTPLYMAPEQSRGGATDARSDIFSFGIVLYEMLAGRKVVDLLAGYGTIPAGPQTSLSIAAVASIPVLDNLIRTCLAPHPDDRWQYMADVLIALKRIKEEAPWLNPAIQERGRRRTLFPWAVAAIVGLLAVAGLIAQSFSGPERATSGPLVRFELVTPPEVASSDQLTLSPDGHYIAEVIETDRGTSLWLRPLDQIGARIVPGTEGASYPFWSPDSKFIGFVADGKLKRVDALGSAVQVLCAAPGGRGGTWNRNGAIIFSGEGPLQMVSELGGSTKAVTELDASRQDVAHIHPFFLPDGDHFLYLARNAKVENSGIYVRSLKTGEERPLLRSAISATFVQPNYLLFTQRRAALAQAMDLKKFTLLGSPMLIAEPVEVNESRGRASLVATENGFLAYRSPRNAEMKLSWFDRSGQRLGSVGETAMYQGVNIASSGKYIIAHRHEEPGGDLFIMDAQTGATRRLTFEPEEHGRSGVWAPDGNTIAFAKTKGGHTSIVRKLASGASSEETVLAVPDADVNPVSWSRDGTYMLYEYQDSKSGTGLWALPTSGNRKPIPITAPQALARHGQFSPDGRWVAYRSNASGRPEVYVEPFPPTGAKWQVSARGGDYPRWRGDGKEIYFIALDRKLMAVEVTAKGGDFENGVPEELFQTRISYGPGVAHIPYAVAADGRRFLITTLDDRDAGTAPVVVLVNWTAVFKK